LIELQGALDAGQEPALFCSVSGKVEGACPSPTRVPDRTHHATPQEQQVKSDKDKELQRTAKKKDAAVKTLNPKKYLPVQMNQQGSVRIA
jgi:hypothetical protein